MSLPVRDTWNRPLVLPSSQGKLSDAFLNSLDMHYSVAMQVLFQEEQQEIAVEEIGEADDRRLRSGKPLRVEMASGRACWKTNKCWRELLVEALKVLSFRRQHR